MSYKPFLKREAITFRRFSRKRYALFSVLGREVRVGVLGVATLASAAPRLAQAAAKLPSDSIAATAGDTVSLAAAVVEASPAVTRVTDASALLVQALTREDVAATAAVTSVNDLLKLATGADVRQRGGFGMQTDISIDGGTFDQIALFVNGFPLNNPQTGHNAADFPLNLSDIERVEVLEGAAASLFGAQAFSGAVNVITRSRPQAADDGDPAARTIEATLSGGSYGTLLAEARAAAGRERAATSLSASFRRSDGAVRNSAFQGGKAFWQGRFGGRGFAVSAQAGASLNDFGANTFYSAAYPDQWEATRRFHVGLRGESAGAVRFVPEVSWLRSADHFQLIRHSATGENFHRSDTWTAGARAYADWRADHAGLRGTLTAGAEVRLEEIYSTNLGRPLDEDARFSHYTRHDDRTSVALSLGHTLRLRGWTLDLSALAHHASSAGRHMRLYPGASLAYRPQGGARRWRFTASWQRTFRLPTFTDLYYRSPTQEGNTGLRAERSSALRLGAEWRAGGVEATARAFLRRGTGMIDWVMFSADDVYHATAFRLNSVGASLDLAADLRRLLGARQPLRRAALSYAYVHQHRRDGTPVFKSNYALEHLRHKFTARLDHAIVAPRLGATWTLRVQRREGSYLVYRDGAATGELRPYGTHAILDCKLRWTAARWEAFADLSNLTATRYHDLGNVPQPRFLLMAGCAVRL